MNITDSKIKFMKNGNIYTLLQKDEDGKVKFKYNDTTINIATKDEVIENLPHISYLDTVKIYYYLNGECIQLAVKEDVEHPSVYSLDFNNENEFENTPSVAMFRSFAAIRSLNVEKINNNIEYNTNNEFIYDDTICEAYENGIILQTRDTDQVSSVINLAKETEINTKNIYQDSLTGMTIETVDLDVTRQVYNLTKEGASGDEYTFNNAMSQTYFSGLSYTEVEG